MSLRCPYCPRSFKHKSRIEVHVKSEHTDEESRPTALSKFKCLEEGCAHPTKMFRSNNALVGHLTTVHSLPFETIDVTFASDQEFEDWKMEVEDETSSFYSKQKSRAGKYSLYKCNRGGVKCAYSSKPTIDDANKRRHTKETKLGFHCTSLMVVHHYAEDNIHVTWTKTHYGHDMDLSYLPITNNDKLWVVNKLQSGYLPSEIIEMARAGSERTSKRLTILKRQDIANIEKTFNLEHRREDTRRKNAERRAPRARELKEVTHGTVANAFAEHWRSAVVQVQAMDVARARPELLKRMSAHLAALKALADLADPKPAPTVPLIKTTLMDHDYH